MSGLIDYIYGLGAVVLPTLRFQVKPEPPHPQASAPGNAEMPRRSRNSLRSTRVSRRRAADVCTKRRGGLNAMELTVLGRPGTPLHMWDL